LVETLRAVASQVEADPALAARLMAVPATTAEHEAPPQATPRPPRGTIAPPLDPFAALRRAGELGLQEGPGPPVLASRSAIVRSYRLDPARISARWTMRERIIDLIVEQAQARLNHGRAFERV